MRYHHWTGMQLTEALALINEVFTTFNTIATYVFLDVVQTTIIGDKSSNLLSILNELHPSTLSDSRVGLLSLNTTAKKHRTH
jgi:hypothetical protein